MNTTPAQPHTYDDEIDLIELVQDLWHEKWLIIAIGFVTSLIALIYALVATPVYQATAYIQEPTLSQIQSYNTGRKLAGLSEFTPKGIYSTFITEAKSRTLARNFLQEVYLPTTESDVANLSEQQLLARLSKLVNIKQTDPKANPNNYEISFTSSNAKEAARFANAYLNLAIDLTKEKINLDINSEVSAKIEHLTARMNNLRANAERIRFEEIERLEEALEIAKSVGITKPVFTSGKTTAEGANYVDRNLTYLRGSVALESQLKVLKNRKNDDPFIGGLSGLKTELELLTALDLEKNNAEIITIDQLAEVPENRIKPKRKLILAVGIVAGGMLGVFAALIRSMLRKRAKQLAQQAA